MKLLSMFCMLLFATAASAQTTELANCPGQTTVTFFGENIFAVQVPSATMYEWTFTNTATSAQTVNFTTWHSNKLSDAGLFDLNATYDVTIRAEVSGVYGAAGSSCQVVSPAGVAATQLAAPLCDSPTPLASFSTTILCANVGGATEYEFEFTNTSTNTVTTYTNTFKSAKLSLAGLFDLNTTYSVRVRAKVGTAQGAYGTTCTIVSPGTQPSTSLRTCGLVLNTFTGNIKAFTVAGATSYKFDFYTFGTTTLAASVTESVNQTTLSNAGLLLPNEQYDVEVSVILGTGSTFTTPGASCTVLSPAIVQYTSLGASCGFQAINFSDVFNCSPVTGATQYEFEFTDITNGSPTVSATSATTAMDLTTAGITTNNATYSVKVKATVNGVVGLYGLACNVKSPKTITLPSLVHCNVTLATYVSNIATYQVPGATSYRYRFTNTTPSVPNPITIFDSTYHIINLNSVGLLDAGTTYDVEISALLSGNYTSYGAICQVTSPALSSSVYSTTLSTISCGATLPLVTTKFATYPIIGATSYDFEMTNTSTNTVTVISKNWHVTTLGQLGLTDIGAVYSVRTRATVNGIVGPYSTSPCIITGPTTVPTTSLNYTCNSVIPGYSTWFPAHDVPGASEYTFHFTNTATLATFTVISVTRNMSLTIAGISDVSTTFDVKVKAKLGSTYGVYGSVCSVTTPSFSPMVLNDNNNTYVNVTSSTKSGAVATTTTTENQLDAVAIEFNAYPNPATNFVNVTTTTPNYTVTIFSTDGKAVYQSSIENNSSKINLDKFTTGIYIIAVANSEGSIMETKRLSVIK